MEETVKSNMTAIARLAIAGLICGGGCAAAHAQTIYKVEGVIYGPDSRPVVNVLVSLENNARAQVGQEVTNTDGRYQFIGIVAGVYYLVVKPDETQYHRIIQQLELINTSVGGNSISTERLDFTLKPKSRASAAAPGAVFLQSVPPEAEQQYQSGLKTLKKGDKEQATEQFLKAVQVFPDYFLALQQLGLVYVELGKYQQALEPLTRAVKINPKSPESYLALGMAHVNLDQLKPAVEELKQAVALDSRLFRAYLFLGMAFIGLDELEAAEQNFKQAYSLGGPVQARAVHLYLASIYDKRKQYDKAINELETYVKENPKAPNTPKIQEAIHKLKAKQ